MIELFEHPAHISLAAAMWFNRMLGPV